MIIGDPKLISGDNLRLAYSSVNSKFYPLPINENIIELEKVNGGFEHNLNKYGNQFSRLFYLLTQDDDLRYLRNKKVYQFVIENEISGDIEKQITQYLPYALSYKTNNYNTRYINYQLKSMKKAIEHNLKAIKSNFKYSKAYVNVIGEGNTITMDLIPDSIAEIKFNELKMHLLDEYSGSISIVYDNGDDSSSKYSMVFRNTSRIIDLGEFMEDFYFSVGLDEDLNPKKRTYRFEISFDAEEKVLIENLTIKMRNDITGIEIDVDDVYVQIIDSNEYYDVPEVFLMDEFGKKYPTLNLAYNDETERLTLLKGDYILEKDLIIPRINAFIMEAGVNVLMGKNKSILSYSPVNVEGSRSEPVVIRSLVKDKPFGTFAILGEGKEKSKSTIDWLDISGGNEKWINGVYFSGQLSIYHVDVNINNVAVHGGHADDGLIVKYSYVVIDNSDFYDNVADQADLDFVFGVVKNSDFKGSKEGKGGDNLDLSGSRILIRNNKFSQSTDKGISIGEETEALLYKNTFSNNNVSVAVKDLSKVYFVENSFSNNNIAINSYQKKPLFGGSFSYIYDNDYISNGKDFSTDEKSKIYKINLTNNQYSTLVNNAENDIVTFPKVKG